jgi:hypothetical protein
MKIECTLDGYDGSEDKKLKVERHWNQYDSLVVLTIGDVSITVSATQLHTALESVTER